MIPSIISQLSQRRTLVKKHTDAEPNEQPISGGENRRVTMVPSALQHFGMYVVVIYRLLFPVAPLCCLKSRLGLSFQRFQICLLVCLFAVFCWRRFYGFPNFKYSKISLTRSSGQWKKKSSYLKFELSEGPDFVYTEVTITKPTHDYRKSHSRMTS